MTSSARPEHWQDLIAGYAAGDLNPQEAEVFQQLLETQPELAAAVAAEVAEFQTLIELMYYAPPNPNPPERLRSQILSQAQAIPQETAAAASEGVPPNVPDLTPVSQSRRQTQTKWFRIGGAIAALALLALAIDNILLRQSLQQNQRLAALLRQPKVQLYALQGTEKQQGASASLVITAQQAQATIVTQNLPTLPAGEAYRLWAIVANKADPVFCGQFNSNPGEAVAQWKLPSTDCKTPQKLLITAELANAAPVPAGPLVLQ